MRLPPPPEWAPHEAVWIGFPSDPELWLGDLKPAESEVAAFAEAVHAGGKGEKVWLVAAHDGAAESARKLCPFAEVVVEPFGDIWLRDTGPIVTGSGKGRRAQGFGFNGWGGKYELDGESIIQDMAALLNSNAPAALDGLQEFFSNFSTTLETAFRKVQLPVIGDQLLAGVRSIFGTLTSFNTDVQTANVRPQGLNRTRPTPAATIKRLRNGPVRRFAQR